MQNTQNFQEFDASEGTTNAETALEVMLEDLGLSPEFKEAIHPSKNFTVEFSGMNSADINSPLDEASDFVKRLKQRAVDDLLETVKIGDPKAKPDAYSISGKIYWTSANGKLRCQDKEYVLGMEFVTAGLSALPTLAEKEDLIKSMMCGSASGVAAVPFTASISLITEGKEPLKLPIIIYSPSNAKNTATEAIIKQGFKIEAIRKGHFDSADERDSFLRTLEDTFPPFLENMKECLQQLSTIESLRIANEHHNLSEEKAREYIEENEGAFLEIILNAMR